MSFMCFCTWTLCACVRAVYTEGSCLYGAVKQLCLYSMCQSVLQEQRWVNLKVVSLRRTELLM